ncbi:16S rRNA (cytosine(967)-C(5))-methyltransferase RsmB [Stenoxybacter acetivorans]|uniref:16S rRNA (cytosine(967)-C(5))-methyltransferase RsmB n=1 Tax=Stenoxybacter acetivorans TaxID=422441 RepID=UPI0005641B12|nr:16S rRNA (cytosine(967)-C(5))-methyltransferase RsmB [Stenoxybacter acetivorans]
MSMVRAQKLAAQTLLAVEQRRNLSDVLTETAAQCALSAAEKGAWYDFAYGCLRYRGLLRQLLAQMLKQSAHRDIETLLCVALYQLLYTRNAPYAVVNEAVNNAAAIQKGRYKHLVNAVLRRFLREQDALLNQALGDETAQYNLPAWWLRRLRRDYPQAWQTIIHAYQQHPPLTLRVNRRHHTAESYLDLLQAADMNAQILDKYALTLSEASAVHQLPGFEQGWVSVQDFGAQQAAPLLNPQKGERVLDACAAPGGKTGHLLEWADCDVTALDIDAERLVRVRSNINRLGFQASIHCAAAQNLSAWYDNQLFDAVLADVPCTASGVVKRHPDIKWLRREQDAAQTAAQQVPLLDALWQVLKSGGRLLLATCSVFQEENQTQLAHFLQRHADADCRETRVLLPSEQQDGFFYALIHKN